MTHTKTNMIIQRQAQVTKVTKTNTKKEHLNENELTKKALLLGNNENYKFVPCCDTS